jgi:hypothetical protein
MSPVRRTRRRSLAALAALAGTAALLSAAPAAAQAGGVSGSSVAVAVNPTIGASQVMPTTTMAMPTMGGAAVDTDDNDLAVDASSVPAAAQAQAPGSRVIFGDCTLAISKPKLMFKLFNKFPNLAVATNSSASSSAVADLNVVVAKRMLALEPAQATAVKSLEVPDLLGFLLGIKKQQLSWLSQHMNKGLIVGSPLKIGAMTIGYVPGAVQAAPTIIGQPSASSSASASASASVPGAMGSSAISGGSPGSLVVGPGGVVLGTVNQGGDISMGASTGAVMAAPAASASASTAAAVAPGVDAMEGPPAIVAPVAPPPVVAMPPAIPRPAVVAAPAPIPAPAGVVKTPMSVPAAPKPAVPAAVPATAAAAAAPAPVEEEEEEVVEEEEVPEEEEVVEGEGDYEEEEDPAAADAAAAAGGAAAAPAPAGTPALLSDGPANPALRPEAGRKRVYRYASDSAAAAKPAGEVVSLDAVAAKLFAPVEAIALVVNGVKGKIAKASAADVADLNTLAGLMG